MKKLLIVIPCYLFPNIYGGPITSIRNLANSIHDEYEIFIVAMNHDWNQTNKITEINEGWNKIGYAKVKYLNEKYDHGLNFLKSIKRIINDENIDLIYSNVMFFIRMSLPIFISKKIGFLKKTPLLVATRGDIMENTLKIKRFKKQLFLFFFNILKLSANIKFHATSLEEKNCIMKYLKTTDDNVFLVPNIPSIHETTSRVHKEKGKLKIVFLSRINIKKNLAYAIDVINKLEGIVEFDIYGAIEHQSVWKEAQELIKSAPSNIKISYKGLIDQHLVIETLSNYHVFFFPTQSENYGHVIAEAVAAKCIPVISNKTPWNDLVDFDCGFVHDLSENTRFIESLNEIVQWDDEKFLEHYNKLSLYKSIKLNTQQVTKAHINMFMKIITKG